MSLEQTHRGGLQPRYHNRSNIPRAPKIILHNLGHRADGLMNANVPDRWIARLD